MLFNDSFQLLIVYPSKQLQDELQDTFLANSALDVNVYVYDKPVQVKEEIDWLLSVFKQCDNAILDIDNSSPWTRDLLSYMIAKNKTYWLTNSHDSVYNSLSNNRVYNLDFLTQIGDNFETQR
jgi:hypothetical protein|tara:strand:- start:805 stop:1173 length:369 start_codon:yes stop_codon:yes gene_type:complete